MDHLPAPPSALRKRSELPSVTVVVRSYKRLESLLKLLAVLRGQDHPDYEVVVLEQSDFTVLEKARLDSFARDPRFRFVYSQPLGVGGARDAAWRHARKQIVLSVDDDDLPLGNDFVRGHARNYLAPEVIAVTGRHVYTPDEECGYGLRFWARRSCLHYNVFGYPHAFCRFDERIESVQWVHGTNGSVRKSVIERVGGWDVRSTNHDEHPFCLRLLNLRRPNERLVFDPSVRLLRNKDVPGGAEARYGGSRRTFETWLDYYHGPVARNRPLRFALLYPVLPLASSFSAARWIWTDSKVHPSFQSRLRDTARTTLLSPAWYGSWLVGRVAHAIRRALPSRKDQI